MAKKGPPKSKKGAKKSFYEVCAPVTSTKILIYATSPEILEGRTIKLDLTKNLWGKSTELKLKIKNKEGKLIGEPESVELSLSYIRRTMRKSSDYAEDSFETECRDKIVKVKPLLVTRKRVSRAVLKAIREKAKKHLKIYLKTRNAEEIISEIVTNKLQKQLALKLKKIYPLAICEIRSFRIIKPLEKKEKTETEKEK